MASEKKKRKLKNSWGCAGTLKNKDQRIKRFLFFTPSLRRLNNRIKDL